MPDGCDLILCVDDEPAILRLCSMAVGDAGFRVAVEETASAGLATFLRLRDEICLVLSDVTLPGMSGVELADRIREAAPGARVLLMTGYADDVLAGRDDLPLIRKPFLASELVARIRSVLDGAA